jgi:putative addiction module killer protein
VAVRKIKARLARVAVGNFGDHRTVGDGVIELRIHFGAGYRVYVGQHGEEIVVLLCGGDKSTQQNDIRQAHHYWTDFQMRLI